MAYYDGETDDFFDLSKEFRRPVVPKGRLAREREEQ